MRREIAILDGLLAAARTGRSDALVLRGEAGVGKSALLEDVVARSQPCRVARAVGIESEMELAYSGLHQLCQPFMSLVDQLPPPQRDALGTAFGLLAGPAPDRFLTGLAELQLSGLDDADARALLDSAPSSSSSSPSSPGATPGAATSRPLETLGAETLDRTRKCPHRPGGLRGHGIPVVGYYASV